MGEAPLSFEVEAGELAVAARRGCRSVECMVCSVGILTACMSAASAIYKAPAGIFVGHKCAYYVSVVVAGLFGLAEAYAALVWLSAGADDPAQAQRQRVSRRWVLCASLLPLAFMAGIGGVRMLLK
ncbi:hypothetical protein ZWY2020_054179 [Hordeum vulgare]|nr:hypothetical protein ZWY2020_054179 [Hordeum vulgare]